MFPFPQAKGVFLAPPLGLGHVWQHEADCCHSLGKCWEHHNGSYLLLLAFANRLASPPCQIIKQVPRHLQRRHPLSDEKATHPGNENGATAQCTLSRGGPLFRKQSGSLSGRRKPTRHNMARARYRGRAWVAIPGPAYLYLPQRQVLPCHRPAPGLWAVGGAPRSWTVSLLSLIRL